MVTHPRIADVKTFLVNADTGGHAERPRGRNWLFVKITTDSGLSGVGEGGGWPEVVEKGIQELRHFLVGEDPFATERLWLKIYDLLHAHGLTGAVRGGVLSALDMALWDIKGKALDVPVYELLGGKVWDKLRVYGHASTPEQAKQLTDRGFSAFKCAPRVEVVRALRETVGPGIEIGVHGHGELSPGAAVELGQACERYAPAFYEEPTSPDDMEALARVAAKVNIPIAMGERLFSKWSFRDVLDRNIVDLIQPEITRIGGILEQKKVAALAEARSVKVAPHDGSAGPIAEMANIHLCASIPNFRFLEHRAEDVPWRSTVALGVISDRDGYLAVPDKPGLGIEIDEEECAKHPPRPTESYQYRHRTPDQIQQDRA
ncbi:MAG: mandelate racemase/muconate lactonizing enzyme family protein [Chloroflexota bacterium]